MSWVRKLEVQVGEFKLKLRSFEILDEGITVVMGPSGSGKSTLLRCLLGLEPKAKVEWEFVGELLSELPPPQRRVGVVFQSYDLFPHLTAYQNILFAAQARKLSDQETKDRLYMILERLGLQPCAQTKAEFLSGGERQRVALGRALIARPRILFLDEPFASLDLDARHKARELVQFFVSHERIPALLVTHDPEDVKMLADRVLDFNALRVD